MSPVLLLRLCESHDHPHEANLEHVTIRAALEKNKQRQKLQRGNLVEEK